MEDEQKFALEQFEKRLRESEITDEEVQAKLEEAQQPSREDAERRVQRIVEETVSLPDRSLVVTHAVEGPVARTLPPSRICR